MVAEEGASIAAVAGVAEAVALGEAVGGHVGGGVEGGAAEVVVVA